MVLGNENEEIIYDFNRIYRAMDSHSDLYSLQQADFNIDRESIGDTLAEHLGIVKPENDVRYSRNGLTRDGMAAKARMVRGGTCVARERKARGGSSAARWHAPVPAMRGAAARASGRFAQETTISAEVGMTSIQVLPASSVTSEPSSR